MENGSHNVIYIDRHIRGDGLVRGGLDALPSGVEVRSEISRHNVRLLVDVLGEVFVCGSGGSCMTQWVSLQDTAVIDSKPTIILIDTPWDEQLVAEPASEELPNRPTSQDESELFGLALLERIVSEANVRGHAKLVVPVPLIDFPEHDPAGDGRDGQGCRVHVAINGEPLRPSFRDCRAANRRMIRKCLDLGAVDIMGMPLTNKCITSLGVHAYRAHKEAARDRKALLERRRERKRSWVGISEEEPYAYLREAMVSGLMNRICRVENEVDETPANVKVFVPAEKQTRIVEAVRRWHFKAHDLSDDELVFAAAVMFRHALSMSELEPWRIPTDQLHGFLMACRGAYNDFVPYHNFRHVVDVLQATFHFLLSMGLLPPMDGHSPGMPRTSPAALLLGPFEALTLLITAIGHDVGHPGVNNGFLITLNAPLAQLYNDRSVLESFHCAAFSQLLRRYWPSVFEHVNMRRLMISSILATDMGLHNDYMRKMGALQDRLVQNSSTEGWSGSMIEEQTSLACALVIKCADISNVARKHDAAVQWMNVLHEEFSRQANMEEELDIPTTLMAPSTKDTMALVKSQLNFMDFIASPLFEGVADLMPSMQYMVDELKTNKHLFEEMIADAQAHAESGIKRNLTYSPKTTSLVATPELCRASADLGPNQFASATATEDRSSTQKDLTQVAAASADTYGEPGTPSRAHAANGIVATYDAVANYARNDPFHTHEPLQQRHSETTEGGSAPGSGDWASQTTSATTDKMLISPSTQGTSIMSRDSLELPNGSADPASFHLGSGLTSAVSGSLPCSPEIKVDRAVLSDKSPAVQGYDAKDRMRYGDAEVGNSNTLKKKPSRFKINALPFFRRHKTPSPPMRAADTAG